MAAGIRNADLGHFASLTQLLLLPQCVDTCTEPWQTQGSLSPDSQSEVALSLPGALEQQQEKNYSSSWEEKKKKRDKHPTRCTKMKTHLAKIFPQFFTLAFKPFFAVCTFSFFGFSQNQEISCRQCKVTLYQPLAALEEAAHTSPPPPASLRPNPTGNQQF